MEVLERQAPENLSVVLHMDEALQASLRRHIGVVAEAEACTVDSQEMAEIANTEMRGVIVRRKALEGERKGFLEPAQSIIERAKNLFSPAIAALERAEGIYKAKLLNFQQDQQRKADEARRAAEDAARKARQVAEAQAAAERARAEEQAREARRRAEEAEAARRKAEAEGNVRAAAAAAAEKAKAEERERAVLENGEAKAMQAQLAAANVQPAVPVPEPTKIAGFSSAKNWIAELAPGFDEEKAKDAIVVAIATGRRDLLSVLALDMKAAGKLAKALEKNFNVPGLTARNNPTARSGRS